MQYPWNPGIGTAPARLAVVGLTAALLLVPALARSLEAPANGGDAAIESQESTENRALTIDEPMYFVIGHDDDTTGRFQFSFKYRMFAEDGEIVGLVPWLERFHFGYTQTSLWNLSDDSAPFEDTSYRPSFFWQFFTPAEGWRPDYLRTGVEHESNGEAGAESRSINTVYFSSAWQTRLGGRDLVIAPKVYGYLSKGSENEDIEDYMGNADLVVRYGKEDGLLLAGLWRHGNAGYNTYQLDVSYPIRKNIFARTGGYVYLQAFRGYGESLATYDVKTDLQVRIGFAIVR